MVMVSHKNRITFIFSVPVPHHILLLRLGYFFTRRRALTLLNFMDATECQHAYRFVSAHCKVVNSLIRLKAVIAIITKTSDEYSLYMSQNVFS